MPSDLPKGFKLYTEDPAATGIPKGFKPYTGDAAPAKPDRPATLQRPVKSPGLLDRMSSAAAPVARGLEKYVTAPISRGVAPYAAAAGVGAAMGAPLGGVGAIPGAAAGVTAAGLTDLGLAAYNMLARPAVNAVAGSEVLPKAKSLQDYTNALLSKMGVSETTTPAQRILEATAGGVASGGVGNLAAKELARATGTVGAANAEKLPGLLPKYVRATAQGGHVGSAITGGVSSLAAQGTAEAGGGPLAQLAASFLAPAIPMAGGAAGRSLVGVKSPKDIAALRARVQEAKDIGMSPTLGQVGGSTPLRALEKVQRGTSAGQERLGRVKGALEDYVTSIVKSTGTNLTPAQAKDAVQGLGKATNPDTAGLALQKSLGSGWMKRVKPVEEAAWSKWEGAAGSREMGVDNTIAYLQKRAAPIPGAEASSDILQNRRLNEILGAARADMELNGKKTLPYQYAKALRSEIGDSLDPKRLSADTNIGDLKALYASLSEDMRAHARSLGPDALKDFNRANRITQAKMARAETYLQKIQNKEPGEVWRYATNPDAVENGGRRFLTINRSLAPDERPMLHATFINEMGRKPNGEFDPTQFAENYKRLSPGVHDVLFPGAKGEAAAKAVDLIDRLEAAGTFKKGGMNLPENLAGYLIMSSIMHASPGALAKGLFGLSKMESVVNLLSKPGVIDFVANENRLPPSVVARSFQAARAALMSSEKQGEAQNQKDEEARAWERILQQYQGDAAQSGAP